MVDGGSAYGRDMWLLATDVDDTLIGGGDDLDRFAAAIHDAPLRIVLNSSRPVADVAVTAAGFPPALDITGIIGALGTEIALTGHPVGDWPRRFAGFDREAVAAALQPFGAEPHPDRYQAAHKASFAVAPPQWAPAEAAMRALGFPVRVITSGSSNFDVIPAAAGKAAAVRYVADRLGIPEQRVVTAGDSENDADALTVGHGIAVGNATPGLLRLIAGSAVMRVAAPRSAGILEGLRRVGALDETHAGAPR